MTAPCPRCGAPEKPVNVHGHVQCGACGQVVEACCEGCGQPTTQVDHRVPLADGGNMLDQSNWQPLCGHHHAIKTARENCERRGFKEPRTKVRVDPLTGFPLAGEDHWWSE